jgi:hypothetical protein
MLKINTLSGQPFQTIHVNEDDVTYNDLLKYINIPPHPKFKNFHIYKKIYVRQFVKLFHVTNEINFKDNIDFNKDISILFYCEYYYDGETFGQDLNLPDTSTHDKCKTLIEECPLNIIFISDKMLTDELCELAVRQYGYVLQYVDHQTEEICKLAVLQNGYSLEHVIHQTDKLCKLAVRQNGYSLEYVIHQTDEICKLAVRQNGYALQYVDHQTEEICKLAVRQNGLSLEFVDHQTDELCKIAVRQNGLSLEFVTL